MNFIDLTYKNLLLPNGLDEQKLQTVLDQMMMPGADYADIYMQSIQTESWLLENQMIKSVSFDQESGVGLRVVGGEKTGFAYTNDLSLVALEGAASTARCIAQQGQHGHIDLRRTDISHALYRDLNPIVSLAENEKIEFLNSLDRAARALSPLVTEVLISLSGEHEVVLILNSEGQIISDVRPLVRLNVQVVVEKKNRREIASFGGGGRYGYERFQKDQLGIHYVEEAVRQALVSLEAIPAPAGVMPVVLGPGWPGVLLHEAIGHGLEGDFNRKGSSTFSGRLGERVASDLCTVVDDGSLPERRGSLNVDDEGTPTQRTVLIENGILTNYLQDKLNARLMGMKPTGNGRRESYASLPLPRMTNTFMLPGSTPPEEIIASVEKGLYAVNFDGGQVDITSGDFVFSTSEAYLIEKGKITKPVKGATLIGYGPEVLKKVSMVGTDLKLDSGVGVCGKEGQSVPVGVGQPTLLVDELVVGGTKTS